jgi:(2R)-3-sulfolactate dehydrogenase (NADP+)
MKLAVEDARRFAAALLGAAGAGADDADLVARSLVAADLAGHGGHGLSRLPGYIARLRAGGTVPGSWRVVARRGPVETYDGAGGLGHVHLELATDRAAALAREHGIGVVGVSASNHAGALGVRAARLARDGFVALLVTNAPAVLAPPGGETAVVGTNPIALAAPAPGGPPLICDLATSQVSRGQIMKAAQEKRPIPADWALDGAGHPTTDADAALAGTLMPLGGPKGFALALIVEVLTGGLLGPAVGPEVRDFFSDHEHPQGISHLVLVIDPAAFGDRDGFDARMARLRDAVLAAGEATRLPGSRSAAAEAAAGGTVTLDDGLVERLDSLASELGVEPIEALR